LAKPWDNILKTAKWRKRPQIVDRVIEGEVVLLDLKSGVYYSLNEAGAELWKLIGGEGADESGLAEAIISIYDVTPEEAERDIAELIKDLSAEGLIVKS
jgi:hypothetical protein